MLEHHQKNDTQLKESPVQWPRLTLLSDPSPAKAYPFSKWHRLRVSDLSGASNCAERNATDARAAACLSLSLAFLPGSEAFRCHNSNYQEIRQALSTP